MSRRRYSGRRYRRRRSPLPALLLVIVLTVALGFIIEAVTKSKK